MRKHIIICIFCTFAINMFAQTMKSDRCRFLQSALASEAFKNQYHTCELINKPIILLDTTHGFFCDSFIVCNRKIIFEPVSLDTIGPNVHSGIQSMCNKIAFLYKKKEYGYEFYFLELCSNTQLIVETRIDASKISVRVLNVGVY